MNDSNTNLLENTIAAIATAPGEGSVSIVRLSGPQALDLADQVFCCGGKKPSQRDSHTVVYGKVKDTQGVVDESLMIIMRGPRSYTAEDVVEIHGHGGSTASRRILRAVLDAGARLAEPGEFTKRAFLNGRIDLLQAEAVLDVIRSQSERAGTAALEQLEGSLSARFDSLYEDLLMLAAQLEATLDFPEDELPEPVMSGIHGGLAQTQSQFDELIATWGEGHLLRDGALVVISGRPNVGKSTFLNALLETNRAIVSSVAGTTRDTIEEEFILGGIPLRIVDTAGLRETDDVVEQAGIGRTRDRMAEADLHIHMIDLSAPDWGYTREQLENLHPDHTLVIGNKQDLIAEVPDIELEGYDIFLTSLVESQDSLNEVKQAMMDRLANDLDLAARPHAVISERHRRLLLDARKEMEIGMTLLAADQEDHLVLAASQLRLAVELIGEATGKEYHDALLDQIFGQFCIGK